MASHGSWVYVDLYVLSTPDIQSERVEFVQKLFSEGDCVHGEENNLLRDAWRQDVIECLQYEKNQRKTGDITYTTLLSYVEGLIR